MKYLLTSFQVLLFFLLSVATLSAQNKDSIEGDFEALQALYNATQGDDPAIPVLNSVSELPFRENATYPYMYMINGEIHHLRFERAPDFIGWENAGAPWKDSTGWEAMTPETMGDAVGIKIDSNGRVIEIDMQKVTSEPYEDGLITTGNNLVGQLPVELANLKKLRKFNIKQNFFFGEIPRELISSWKNIERLSFSGQRSEINLDNRKPEEQIHRRVNVSGDHFNTSVRGKEVGAYNRFRTEIPDFIDLPNLELVEIRHQYTLGRLPEFTNCPAVKGVFIDSNRSTGSDRLKGKIPQSWSSLTNIVKLYLLNESGLNRFEGDFPTEISDSWTDLAVIAISNNNFTGPIPEFPKSRDKRIVNLAGNQFTGGFPMGYFNGDNSELNLFSIGSNNLSGTIPDTIQTPTYPVNRSEGYRWMSSFNIQNNNFDGDLPSWITGLPRVQIINVYNNNFTGGFPDNIFDNQLVKTIRLFNNNFSGPLPDGEWVSPRIIVFDISGNNFVGEIPESWDSIFKDSEGFLRGDIRMFNVSSNNLSGTIPDWGKYSANTMFKYGFADNKYTYKDILIVKDELIAALGENFEYENQRTFGKQRTREATEGEELIIDYSAFEYIGNKYQWYRDEAAIPGANGSKLIIQSVDSSHTGIYTLKIENNNLPEIGPLISEEVDVRVIESEQNNDSEEAGSGHHFPAAPVRMVPEHNSEGESLRPNFFWSDIGADYYILHVSRLNPSGMTLDIIVEDTTYTPTEILDDGTIHGWRVRGVKDGEMGEWSEIQRFTTKETGLPEVAELISPGDYAQNVNPAAELVWEDVDADSFKIRLMNRQTSELLISDVSIISSYKITNALPDTTDFVWQVKSISSGIEGAWGPRWEFSTGVYTYSVETPVLIAPERGNEYDNLIPIFEWSEVDADHYVISVSKEASSNAKSLPGLQNEAVVIYDEVYETNYKPEISLEPETRYYWSVQAVKDGEEGGWSEQWEFKTPAQISVDVEQGETALTTNLSQNYPNPFNPATNIEFTLNEIKKVSLKVYDMSGREVAVLVDGVLNSGRYTNRFIADHLSSGVYFYRLVTGDQSYTKKMTLIK